jgi:hypothetical protein
MGNQSGEGTRDRVLLRKQELPVSYSDRMSGKRLDRPGLQQALHRIERAVADGAPEQLKRLLDTVVEQILVESRACIPPYFVAPTVRTRIGSRRRTGIEPA